MYNFRVSWGLREQQGNLLIERNFEMQYKYYIDLIGAQSNCAGGGVSDKVRSNAGFLC